MWSAWRCAGADGGRHLLLRPADAAGSCAAAAAEAVPPAARLLPAGQAPVPRPRRLVAAQWQQPCQQCAGIPGESFSSSFGPKLEAASSSICRHTQDCRLSTQ